MVYIPKSKLIGQGTYGCVYKPSLKCKEKNMDVKDKISKLTFSDDAKKELKEYGLIAKTDPENKYYLGVPKVCTLDVTEENLKSLKYSKCKIQKDLFAELSNEKQLKLLLLTDGGMDLNKYTEKKRTKMEMNHFWVAAHKMFIAVGVLGKHEMLHADLKASNIVYDPVKKDMNLIDFGLSKTLTDFRKKFLFHHSEHWSYPPEMTLYMIKKFNPSHIHVKHILALTSLYYIDCGLSKEELVSARNIFLNATKSISGEEFLNMKLKLEDTFDSYGLGLSLMASLNNTKKLYSQSTYQLLKNCFYGMIHPDYRLRYTIDEALLHYEQALFASGILLDLNYYIEDNTIKKIDEKMRQTLKVINVNIDKIPDNVYEKIQQTPFYSDVPNCKKGEVLSEKTRKCKKVVG